MKKNWYDKRDYVNFTPSTREEWGQRVWDKFNEMIERRELDNSMGDHNYIMGVVLMDMICDFTDEIDGRALKIFEDRLNNELDFIDENEFS